MTLPSRTDAARWLVFGLSGAIGEGVRAAWREDDPALLAVSRQPRADAPRLAWCTGTLPDAVDVAGDVSAVASLGPLDRFAAWFEAWPGRPARVVAIGSTGVHDKRDSPEPAERAIAAALAAAEARLARAAAARGCALTLLRPTLVYGRGADRSLGRIVALARRWSRLPVPADARGLRQPVHADDVAAAVLAALRAPTPVPGRFDLPGGEALPWDEMVARCLAVAAPRARLLRLPGPLVRAALAGLRTVGLGPGPGLVARLGRDQAYDAGPVGRALGVTPRPFRPGADLFPPP